jgi:hypothetical protein
MATWPSTASHKNTPLLCPIPLDEIKQPPLLKGDWLLRGSGGERKSSTAPIPLDEINHPPFHRIELPNAVPSVLCDVISVVTEFMVSTNPAAWLHSCTFSVWTQFTM